MTIERIVNYVMRTPQDTNRAVLVSLLESLVDEVEPEDKPKEVTNVEELEKAFTDGGKIKLKNNLTISSELVVEKDTELILDSTINCNNQRITVDGGKLTLTGEGTITGTNRPIIVENGELVIDGPTITSTNDCAVTAEGSNSKVTFNEGLITAQEVGILGFTGANITMNGGTVSTTDNFCIGGNGSSGKGGTTITINGGKLEGHITSAGYVACGIYHPQDGTLNINGGEISAVNGCGVLMRAGVLNMSSGTVIGSGEPGMKGKVGDSKVTVGPNGIIYDQSAHYPDNQNLRVNVTGGMVIGVDKSIDILKDMDHEARVSVTGATLIPPME